MAKKPMTRTRIALLTTKLVILAALLALPQLLNPYVTQILIITIMYSMLGLSFAFTLRVGLPRFDVAAWWALGAYTTAMLMWRADWPFWATIPIAGIVSAVLGWVVYRVAIPRGMMVFLMFGLVLSLAVQQLFGSINFFGGWGGTNLVSAPTIGSLSFAEKPELYYLGLGFLAAHLVVYWLLYNSRLGRAWNAIGSSIQLASSVGVDVVKYRVANVMISNFFIGIAGSFYIAYARLAVPNAFGLAASVGVMMYVVIGGIEYSLVGPIVGAVIVTFIPEYLRVAQQYESIFSAVITILIIILLPTGILGGLRAVRLRIRSKSEPEMPPVIVGPSLPQPSAGDTEA